MSVRVRFAPSPTGFLHIGVTRTALFNYLLARNQAGQFLLRIEDTDRERSKEEYVRSILEGLKWLGIEPDEPPVRQSERISYYTRELQRLLDEGKAYRCDCSPERLKDLREGQKAAGITPHYDGHCRDRDNVPEEGSVIRLRTPGKGTIAVEDRILGTVSVDAGEIDDFVIAKNDGTPTYQFAVVADDHGQGVTLVLRGNDLLSSTPKQILLYQALGWEPPEHAHLPMILGTDKQKLSKRHGATSLLAYRAMGYLPQTIRNYLVRLGWSYGDQEVFQFEEMIEKFSLESVGKSAAVFNPEKLLWLNGEHIRLLSVPDLTDAWIDHLENLESDRVYLEPSSNSGEESELRKPDLAFLNSPANRPWVESLVEACQIRSNTLVQLTEHAWPFLADEIDYDPKAVKKVLKPASREPLERVRDWVASQAEMPSEEDIHEFVTSLAESLDLNMGKVAQPIRVAITGGTVSPPINTTMSLLGKAKVLTRIERGLALIPELTE